MVALSAASAWSAASSHILDGTGLREPVCAEMFDAGFQSLRGGIEGDLGLHGSC